MGKKFKIKRSWVYASLTLVAVAYLVVMWAVGAGRAAERYCTGVSITVHDTAQYRFVTPQELARELGRFPQLAIKTPVDKINIDSLEKMLAAFDKIEQVQVNILTDGRLLIDVHPMHPVARIFPADGSDSYYINRTGKRIMADARYHIDVPIVSGRFSEAIPDRSILPLLDAMSADSLLNHLVTMVKVDSPTDIILIPRMRGMVINLGDTLDYEDKFRRLRTMYSRVLNVRGWNMYDTISVKWPRQVVATRRDKTLAAAEMVVETANAEEVNAETMMAGPNVAPGQALPGQPAKNDKLIPARKKEPVAAAAPPEEPATETPQQNE